MARGAFASGDGCCKLVGLASGSVYRKQMGYACSAPYFTGIYCLLFRRLGMIYKAVFARSSVNVVNSTTGPNRTANHRYRGSRRVLKQVPYFCLPFFPGPHKYDDIIFYFLPFALILLLIQILTLGFNWKTR